MRSRSEFETAGFGPGLLGACCRAWPAWPVPRIQVNQPPVPSAATVHDVHVDSLISPADASRQESSSSFTLTCLQVSGTANKHSHPGVRGRPRGVGAVTAYHIICSSRTYTLWPPARSVQPKEAEPLVVPAAGAKKRFCLKVHNIVHYGGRPGTRRTPS